MIYLTGDCHGDFSKISNLKNKLNKDDYIIVTGDFGYWNKRQEPTFDKLSKLPFTILFVEGNHSNYDMLNELDVEVWNGGNVHFIRDNIIHLMRGQIFNIENQKFFTFGGAKSHDICDGILDPNDFKTKEEFYNTYYLWDMQHKMFRVKGISWWEEELPTEIEMHNALNILEENNWKVDYIITHDCPSEILLRINDSYEINVLNNFFAMIDESTYFKKWYFGHHHIDKQINNNYICLYHNIIKLNDNIT